MRRVEDEFNRSQAMALDAENKALIEQTKSDAKMIAELNVAIADRNLEIEGDMKVIAALMEALKIVYSAYDVTRNVDVVFHEEYRYEGALQGKLGTWYKDSNYFNLCDLSSNSLIKCFYKPDLYEQIYALYSDKNAVVNLSGHIVAGRVSGQITEMHINWARSYAPLSDSEFKRLFGLDPDLTGEIGTADYIDRLRSDGDA